MAYISWYAHDDLKEKRSKVSPEKYEVVPHVIFYIQEK